MITLPTLRMSNIEPVSKRYEIDKEISGVYFFFNDNSELMYIGKTINLRTRICAHVAGSTNTRDISHNFKQFCYVEIEDSVDMDIYETWYINIFKPKLNIEKVLSYTTEFFNEKYNVAETQRRIKREEYTRRLE